MIITFAPDDFDEPIPVCWPEPEPGEYEAEQIESAQSEAAQAAVAKEYRG
jgi:hypothetical protein